MAVDIWNEVTVERSLEFSLENIGIDAEHIPSEINPKTGEVGGLLNWHLSSSVTTYFFPHHVLKLEQHSIKLVDAAV